MAFSTRVIWIMVCLAFAWAFWAQAGRISWHLTSSHPDDPGYFLRDPAPGDDAVLACRFRMAAIGAGGLALLGSAWPPEHRRGG